ncbi:MAG: PspC domain-containing protein [Flavobacteriales bacterium]|nr:PspC domain-containing protein [Flavobacteriales bacterium]
MKKTVTVNISGIVFTMDEDAYDVLQKYLGKIKGYFSKSDGQDEIIADIEARIAEMFHEKIDSKFQVVSILHVEEMMTIMGKPEDLIDDEQQASETEEKEDPKRKEAASTNQEYKSKRLYRDGDGNVVGGVCSGVAYYFGIDVVWIRIVLILLFFAGFSGVFIYIVLWVVIPKAKTTSEKLEMKGEPVNIDNIGKTIEDEIHNIKDKFSKGANNWSQGGRHERARNFFRRIFDFTLTILKAIVKMLGKFVGIGLIIFGVIVLLPIFFSFLDTSNFILSWTTEGVSSLSGLQISSLIFGSEGLTSLAVLAFCLFLGIPALAIVYGGIRLLFGIKSELKGVGIAMTSIWIIGLLLLCYSGYRLALEFKSESERIDIVELPQSVSDTLNLTISKDIVKMSNRKRHRNHGEIFSLLVLDDKINYNGDVELTIEPTQQDSFKIEILSISRGKTNSQALEYAKEINYNYAINENTITFDPYLTIDSDSQIRGQEIDIIIYVPQGKSVYLSDDLIRILYDVDNYTNTLDRDMTDKIWTMTKRGLECIGCDEDDL